MAVFSVLRGTSEKSETLIDNYLLNQNIWKMTCIQCITIVGVHGEARLEYPCIPRVHSLSAFRTPHAAHSLFFASLGRVLEPSGNLKNRDTRVSVVHLNFVYTLPMGVHGQPGSEEGVQLRTPELTDANRGPLSGMEVHVLSRIGLFRTSISRLAIHKSKHLETLTTHLVNCYQLRSSECFTQQPPNIF